MSSKARIKGKLPTGLFKDPVEEKPIIASPPKTATAPKKRTATRVRTRTPGKQVSKVQKSWHVHPQLAAQVEAEWRSRIGQGEDLQKSDIVDAALKQYFMNKA